MPTVQTRYFKNLSVTVNGLTCLSLALDTTGTGRTESYTKLNYTGCTVGLRVWKRNSAGVETEITAGTPVAQVVVGDGEYHALKSNTWNCPETTLASTDSIVVRVYACFDAWYLIGASVFTTEQLGASKLNAATWTVYYYLSFIYDSATRRGSVSFHFDGSDLSRIEGFAWTSYAPPAGVPRFIGDGLSGAIIIV
jgi:hypothetical protein